MHIREFMSTNVKVCVPESSCENAGEIMRRHRRGFLPVVDTLKNKRVIGMVTDRDIMLCLIHMDLPASQVAVKSCMTGSPPMISAESDLDVAISVMKRDALYQLPVLDDGKCVGVLSLEDLALAARRQWAYVGSRLNEQQVIEILEAIAVARVNQKKRAWH